MATIDFVTIEADDPTAATGVYKALGVEEQVRVQPSEAPTSGFRGSTLSLVVSQPANADMLIDKALDAGATALKPAAKSLWGYGGAVQSPDGTIVTVASSSKKDAGPASGRIDEVVLQLGVADVAGSKRFYVDHGFTVAHSYGRKYAQFDSGAIKLTLLSRRSLAKTAGVPPEGRGSHRLQICSNAGAFTDPDGFVWGPAPS